jgi:hypothetical protein
MSKQVISVGGEDKVVREDTAKSFRGVHWALISLAAFAVIAVILMLGGFLGQIGSDEPAKSPAQVERDGRQ